MMVNDDMFDEDMGVADAFFFCSKITCICSFFSTKITGGSGRHMAKKNNAKKQSTSKFHQMFFKFSQEYHSVILLRNFICPVIFFKSLSLCDTV